MAKTISIKCGGIEYDVAPVKIERSKIYGWSQIQAVTPEGGVCSQGGVNNDGITLVGPGCTKPALLTTDGRWMTREDLLAYNPDGTTAQFISSSFDKGIELIAKATPEELLNLNVTAVYQLIGPKMQELINTVGENIYRCTFSYRGGYEAYDAFVIAVDGLLFIISGKSSIYEPIGISQEGVLDNDFDLNFDEDTELDFSMM